MELSPEEREKIYEEEKARIEAGEKLKSEKQQDEGVSSTNLEPNVAALLCYLGIWITGIIFLIIEQKSRFVRFHAIQSIIVFGFLMIVSAVLSQIPFVGWFFSFVLGVLMFVLWIVLMVKAYQGEVYKIPAAGDIAEKTSGVTYEEGKETVKDRTKVERDESQRPPEPVPPSTAVEADATKRARIKAEESVRSARPGRITSSSFAIAWSLIFLIFFNFFNKYIAYYHYESPQWLRYPLLTEDFNSWLPIVTTILIISIIGHSILIAFDRYIFRETTLIILNLFGIAAIVTLISIFPFDFSVIPDDIVSEILPIITLIVLIGISVGLGIATLVSFIKLIANVARGTASY